MMMMIMMIWLLGDHTGAEMELEMDHGSNGSPFLDGSHGSWVIASDPQAHDDEITAQ